MHAKKLNRTGSYGKEIDLTIALLDYKVDPIIMKHVLDNHQQVNTTDNHTCVSKVSN